MVKTAMTDRQRETWRRIGCNARVNWHVWKKPDLEKDVVYRGSLPIGINLTCEICGKTKFISVDISESQ
jgi:hypothetical protein